MPSPQEIDRRYQSLRAAMERENLDALIVCGNQYAGFEGAVLYVSGFEIVHRYVYVVVPLSALHVMPHFSTYSFIANLSAMLVFGWIVAVVAKIFLTPRHAVASPSLSRSP